MSERGSVAERGSCVTEVCCILLACSCVHGAGAGAVAGNNCGGPVENIS